jgi:hypothetical protein
MPPVHVIVLLVILHLQHLRLRLSLQALQVYPLLVQPMVKDVDI